MNEIERIGGITLPTEEEIIEVANKLIESGYTTKNGKLLKFRGNKDKKYDNGKKYSYVEDSIECFNNIWNNGYSLNSFRISDKCHRVTTPTNLTPSWIRSLFKIDGEEICEADYVCLHPNLIQNVMGGSGNHISHKSVAESLKMSLVDVKVEHLSFFNKEVWAMKASKLFDYYYNNEKEMMMKIMIDKSSNGYKNLTYKIFKLEVEIMSNVISQLNELGIYVLYVYDALYCKKSELETVKNIMNNIIKDFGINTFVK